MPEGPVNTVTLQLLDSATGLPLQVWDCSQADRICIGRGEENTIRVVDPHVSRLHAELYLADGAWMIRSLGRNGTWIQSEKIECHRLAHRTIFHLGSSGPMLQFLCQNLVSSSTTATLDNIENEDFDFLNINPQQLADEVARIAETEAFQRLQQTARPPQSGNSSDPP